ncbi:hypothetical protein Nepgr_011195, partial [Nepenthes gracilis]
SFSVNQTNSVALQWREFRWRLPLIDFNHWGKENVLFTVMVVIKENLKDPPLPLRDGGGGGDIQVGAVTAEGQAKRRSISLESVDFTMNDSTLRWA